MAVASVVLGVIAILSCWIPGLGLLLALIALILAILAMANKKTKGEKKDLKVIGLVLSIVATICSFAMTVFLVGGVMFVFDVIEEAVDISAEMNEDPKTADLVEELFGEYISIKMENKFASQFEQIDEEEAHRRYMDILMNSYRELYNEGYDILVDEDLKFELISPEEMKI